MEKVLKILVVILILGVGYNFIFQGNLLFSPLVANVDNDRLVYGPISFANYLFNNVADRKKVL